ncbi:MAG: type pilus assembly protein PilA [Patescibacteria group bacterium]|nr:type pilus assembly protein PilA [Patescibacteria group bacterium]
MTKKFNKGFTLIELLVVIAIIGILSSVVLASLNTARGKGADAAIKSNLANIRAQAEILYDTNGIYDIDATATAVAVGACVAGGAANSLFANTNINNQIVSAVAASTGTDYTNTGCVVGAGATAWAVSVPLKTTTTDSWCVDSTGASRKVTPASGDRGFSGSGCK